MLMKVICTSDNQQELYSLWPCWEEVEYPKVSLWGSHMSFVWKEEELRYVARSLHSYLVGQGYPSAARTLLWICKSSFCKMAASLKWASPTSRIVLIWDDSSCLFSFPILVIPGVGHWLRFILSALMGMKLVRQTVLDCGVSTLTCTGQHATQSKGDRQRLRQRYWVFHPVLGYLWVQMRTLFFRKRTCWSCRWPDLVPHTWTNRTNLLKDESCRLQIDGN